MIVPMKKVTLIALHSDLEKTLDSLRKLGVMQVELADSFSADSAQTGEKLQQLNRILFSLEQLAADNGLPEARKLPAAEAPDVVEKFTGLQEKENALVSYMIELRRKIETLAVWGDFDRELLDDLRDKGVDIRLCIGSSQEYAKAVQSSSIRCREISRAKGKVAFVIILQNESDAADFPVVHLDEKDDPRKLKKALKEAEKEYAVIQHEMLILSGRRRAVQAAAEEVAGVLEFSRVRDSIAEHGMIVALCGFVPAPEMDNLSSAAEKNGWGVLITDPAEDDEVPVLLKENKFTRIIKPLFDFLGIVPGYREIDISGAVLIFFTIFYAIIIGDAGYGIIFGLVSLFGLKAAKKSPKLLPPMRLLLILSIAATIWGALCGSWFGLSEIPGTGIKIPALECFRDFSASSAKQANIQFFCFILAVLQLSTGRIWRVINERNWRAAGQHLGWMMIIWGNFFLTIRLIVYPGDFPVYMYYLYAAGLLLVMSCGVNWKQASDVFQFPFDIIGSFTDVLSYIRLFAVGLAGACIAGSFNGMAFDLVKVSAWLLPAGIAVALIGHALNIVLALLSVLVHAVRLNTLEFSNHTGLSWSGQNFKPFKSNKQEE